MKYPCLVPKSLCKTDIHIVVYREGLSEDGEPIVAFEGDLKCNYQDSAKTILTKEQKLVEVAGSALFCGDIADELAVISDGEAIISLGYMLRPGEKLAPGLVLYPGTQNCVGEKRKILKGTKARNPDGTVNYTRLELI